MGARAEGPLTGVKNLSRVGAILAKRCRAVTMVLAVAASGCTPSRPPLSGAVQGLKGVSCPEERIVVIETRVENDATIYVLDACGSKLEIARGLTVPTRMNEVTIISGENPYERPQGLKSDVVPSVQEVVHKKVEAWCALRGSAPTDPEAFVFYANTESELEECRQRVVRTLRPIGTLVDEDTGQETYLFTMGQYVFAAKETLYDPADARGAKRVSVEVDPETVAARQARRDRSGRVWFGRLGLGTGYVAHRTFNGGSIDIRTELGIKIPPDVGVGLAVGPHWAVLGQDRHQSRILEISLVVPFYPIAGEGLRFDVTAGLALLSYDFLTTEESGPLVGGGVGWDFGARSRKRDDFTWTGMGLTLRGFYASPGGYDTGAGIFEAAVYAW